jgi:hypothetical protein
LTLQHQNTRFTLKLPYNTRVFIREKQKANVLLFHQLQTHSSDIPHHATTGHYSGIQHLSHTPFCIHQHLRQTLRIIIPTSHTRPLRTRRRPRPRRTPTLSIQSRRLTSTRLTWCRARATIATPTIISGAREWSRSRNLVARGVRVALGVVDAYGDSRVAGSVCAWEADEVGAVV